MVFSQLKAASKFTKAAPAKGVMPGRSNTATVKDYERMYASDPSFVDLLPWVEYIEEEQAFLFNDGISYMSALRLEPIPTEGRSQEDIEEVSRAIARVVAESCPEEDTDPWVIQLYLNSEPSLDQHIDRVKASPEPDVVDSEYTREFMRCYEQHVHDVADPDGVFYDNEVLDAVWRGRMVTIRMVVYRRYWKSRPRMDARVELSHVLDKVRSGLSASGVKSDVVDGPDFYRWMLQWMNPRPAMFEGDVARMINTLKYPDAGEQTIGMDLAEMVMLEAPVSDRNKGLWYLDGLPHCVVQASKLDRRPSHGALSGEVVVSQKLFSIIDRLPLGSVVSMTVFVLAQDTVKNRIKMISDRAIGDTAESSITRRESAAVLEKQARNDKLFPMEVAIFLRAENERELRRDVSLVRQLMGGLGLQTVNPENDPIAIDSFVKNLPGVQIEALDRKARRRSRLTFSTNIGSLAPIYGRGRGTGTPGLLYWNRSGEPLAVDPLSLADRRKNAHLLTIGGTGAGKSAMLVWMLMSMLAIHRPKVYIIELGNSFGLFGDHAAENGLSVHKVTLSYNADVSIPPFANVIELADQPRSDAESDPVHVDEDGVRMAEEFIEDDEDEEDRDILGEAEMIAVLMITGGEERELANLKRSNRMAIRRAILLAAKTVRARGERNPCVTPTDIADALEQLACDDTYSDYKTELREMSDSMRLFCDGLNGKLFDQKTSLWPEADVTIIDMAMAGREGNEDTLAVAYTSLMQHINAEVERNQMESRQTIVLTDEAHKILKNKLLMPYVVSITKMWRKLGAWYWIGTQNFKDFPGTADVLLNMMEWWLCLQLPTDEVEQASKFTDLSEMQKTMMAACKKEPGKYTEGVLLANAVQTLFRNVPPALPLALAQTEKEEKARRQKIMNEQGCTEVQAAYKVAEQIAASRKSWRNNS